MPYLIDGNNLLGSWGGPASGKTREEVLRRVAAFCRQRGARAIIVFDGAPFRPEIERQQLGGVSVRFPAPGDDADAVIRSLVEGSARPAELTVVTSDKALYSYAKTLGTRVLRAHEWNRIEGMPATAPHRRVAASHSEKPSHETDVEGWLRRFGEQDSGEPGEPDPARGSGQPAQRRAKRR